jgi:hypothetical protein
MRKALEWSEFGDSNRHMAKRPLNPHSDFVCTGISNFERVLEQWIKIQSEFDAANEEGPFNYTERPQVGFLAAAIWRANGMALEEWKTEKVGGGSGAESNAYNGRCDLWFNTTSKPKDSDFGWYLEAKHLWMRGSEIARWLGDPELNGLEQAIASAKRRKSPEGRLGCVFISVFLDGKKGKIDDEHLSLLQVLPQKAREVDTAAVAWYITSRERVESLLSRQSAQPKLTVATILLIASC